MQERVGVVHRDAFAQPQPGRVLGIKIAQGATPLGVQAHEVPGVKKLVRQLGQVSARVLREVTARHSDGDRGHVLERAPGPVLEEESVVRVGRLAENRRSLPRNFRDRIDELDGVEGRRIRKGPVRYGVGTAVDVNDPLSQSRAEEHGRIEQRGGVCMVDLPSPRSVQLYGIRLRQIHGTPPAARNAHRDID